MQVNNYNINKLILNSARVKMSAGIPKGSNAGLCY